jgi:broad specificity phosphatase PhoE
MQATRFILVRHGETAANRDMRYIGTRDDALTERGHEQARLLARALTPLPVAAIYTSPRQRARATAQPLADQLNVPALVVDDLRESAFGAWEGMSRAEVLAHSPGWAEHLRAWEADATVAPPDGESIAAMTTRVAAFAERLLDQHVGKTVVFVAHVGPVKAMVAATLGVTPAVVQRMFLDPATISVVDWSTHKRFLRLFNSHAHLGWTEARWMAP